MFPRHVWWYRVLVCLCVLVIHNEAIAKTEENPTVDCEIIPVLEDNSEINIDSECSVGLSNSKLESNNLLSCAGSNLTIYGVYRQAGELTLQSIEVATKTSSTLGQVEQATNYNQGNTSIDPVNGHYFTVTNLGATSIDLETADVLCSEGSTASNFIGIEYDDDINSLWGYYINGGDVMLAAFNLGTKSFGTPIAVSGIDYAVQGVSTFDPVNRRYIFLTNLGVTVLDLPTGNVVCSVPVSVAGALTGLEYDIATNTVIGTYWNGTNTILTSLNLTTKTYTDLGTIPGVTSTTQGNTTFDAQNGWYFMISNLGITVVDVNTSTIVCTIDNTVGLAGIEVACPPFSSLSFNADAMNMTVECDGNGNQTNMNTWLSSNGGASAVTDCPPITWSNNYTDLSDDCGETGFVEVTFTAVDNCAQSITTQATFTIVDTTPPSLPCNEVANLDIMCESPTANADIQTWVDENLATLTGSGTDDCSMMLTGTSNFTIGSVNTAACNSSAEITFTVSDECGNESTCSGLISIDQGAECIGLSCPTSRMVLLNGGTEVLLASAINPGIFDECGGTGPYNVEIARMLPGECLADTQTNFGPSITFCCLDIGNVIMVRVRVSDLNGHFGMCMIEVTVKDQTNPQILSCPNNTTAECGEITDINNLSAFGQVTVFDACTSNLEIDEDVEDFLDSCGEGYLLRTWTVTDLSGNEATCSQRITITNNNPIVESDITWPAHEEFDNLCNVAIPGPDVTGYPIYPSLACSQLLVNHTDDAFDVGPGCIVVTRSWSIIDWCQFENGAPPSTYKWQYEQILTFTNGGAPNFVNCEPTVEGCGNEQTCYGLINLSATAVDDCTASDDIQYSYRLTLEDGTVVNGNGNTITGDYPYGEHTILWRGEDFCGNVGTCQQVVTIKDCQAPSVICLYGINMNLTEMPGAQPMAIIWASDLDASSTDNCTAYEDIEFAFDQDFTQTSMTFDCNDVGQDVNVILYARDEDGNIGLCKTYVGIQDNHGFCPETTEGGPGVNVSGRIATESDLTMNEVDVMLQNNAMEMHYMTNDLGQYAFSDLPMYEDYSLNPSFEGEVLNGVSTLDIIYIQRHILGLEKLDSPYKILAADANDSESISATDVIEIRKVILGLSDGFKKVENWRFVDADFSFPDPENPFPFSQTMNLQNLDHDAPNMNFIGIKSGDVNNTVNIEGFIPQTLINRSSNNLVLESNKLGRGLIQITVNETQRINGFQMAFRADRPVNVISLESEIIDIDHSNFALDGDLIKISWSGAEELVLDQGAELFKLQLSGDVEFTFNEQLDFFETEAYDQDLKQMNIVFNNTGVLASGWEIFKNTPNPFVNQTSIPFIAPGKVDLQLTVFDVNGSIIYQETRASKKGFQTWDLDATNFGHVHGVLYYRLESGDFSSTQPFIRLN